MSFSFYQIKQLELNRLTRGLYDPRPFTFIINDHSSSIDWRELDTSDPFTVFVELDGPFRGFFYEKDTYVPPMVAGRFFQAHDFYQSKKRALVGQTVNQDIIDGLEEDGYDIIGIMGASYASEIDEMVLLNIDAVEDGKPVPDAVYVVNIGSGAFVPDDAIPFKESKLSVNVIDRKDRGALRFIGTDDLELLIIGFFVLLLVSLNLFITHYAMNGKRHEVRILWQLGVPVNQPYLRYAAMIFFLLTASYGLVGVTRG